MTKSSPVIFIMIWILPHNAMINHSYRPHGRYLIIYLRDFSSLRSVGMTDPLGKQPYYYFYFGSDIDVDPKVVLCANLFISTIPY